MPEDAGKLEVEYIVISDAAVRRLERLQKQFDKVEEAANKQADSIEAAFKKAGKTMALFGAITTGVLYGIIRASSYASMWMDQISHQTTRLADKILEITGMDEVIEGFIETLDNLNDELDAPEDNEFWKRLGETWDGLSLKAKILTAALIILGGALGIIAVAGILSKIIGLGVAFGLLAKGTTLTAVAAKAAAIAIGGLKAVLAFLGSTVGIVAVVIAALVIGLGYLWTKTEHGKKQIEALGNAWSNFKENISDHGWLSAIGTLMGDLGHIVLHEFVQITKGVYDATTGLKLKLLAKALEIGKGFIKWLIEGIDKMFPWFETTVYKLYNRSVEIFNLMVTLAYNKASEMLNSFIDGIDDKIPGFRAAWDRVAAVFGYKSDAMVVEANVKSKEMGEKFIDNANSTAVAIWDPWNKVGGAISGGLANGVAGMHEPVCREMTNAEKCAQLGMVAIDGIFDDSLDSAANYHTRMLKIFNATTQAAWDAASEAEKAEYLGGGDSGGSTGGGSGWAVGSDAPSGSGGYAASSWSAGWKVGGYATGGHVLRQGLATVHQGEDIVNLKSLLSGIKSGGDRSGRGDIIINPTINIESNGKMSDPFEANRVADVISKRMGEELRRITTNI